MNHRSIVEDHPAVVPDIQCQHGFRLRSCGIRECVAIREAMFLRATREGRRNTSEPWPNSFGDIDIAVDLTESTRTYQAPELPPYADPRGLWKAIAVTFFFAALLIILGLYAAWVNL